MPLTNWPPVSAPAWIIGISFSDIQTLIRDLRELGWSQAAPTTQERNLYFASARCDEGHQVVGRMLISPEGTRYPFAVCNNSAHRQLLVLWGPDFCMGGGSGVE